MGMGKNLPSLVTLARNNLRRNFKFTEPLAKLFCRSWGQKEHMGVV
jgi:hypothetical protein